MSIDSRIIFSSGEFSYELIPYWAKLPKTFSNAEISSVGCDNLGNVYVLTRDFSMPIMVFDLDGNYKFSFGEGVFYSRPHGIFINQKNELYCTDDKSHIVMKFNKEGLLLKIFGKPGEPSDSGCNWNIYEEYRKANEILSTAPVDTSLSLKMRLDTIKRSAGPFNGPTKMIETQDGELFCSDGYGNAAVHKFSINGEFIKTFGAPGTGDGEFRLPHAVHLDNANNLWVADRENNRIQIFSRNGDLIKVVGGLEKPTDFCTDGSYIYVSQTTGGGFVIFNQYANIVGKIGYTKSPLYMHGIAIDINQDIYGATLGKNIDFNIVKFKRLDRK